MDYLKTVLKLYILPTNEFELFLLWLWEKYLLAGMVMHILSAILFLVLVFIVIRIKTLISHLIVAKVIISNKAINQSKFIQRLPFFPTDSGATTEHAIATKAEICSRKLNRGLLTLSLVAKLTPLIGIAGSVYTAIKTLHTVSVTNQMFPMFAAERIAYSLIPVLYGLVISIIVLSLHSLLRVLIEEIITLWEEIFQLLFDNLHIS